MSTLSTTPSPTMTFYGGGNMARCLIGGLINQAYPADAIHVVDRNADKRETLHGDFGIQTHADIAACLADTEVLVLALKPQQLPDALSALAPTISAQQPLIISVAAGLSCDTIARCSGTANIVRAMPNTPSLYSLGATGLFATDQVSDAHKALAEQLFSTAGMITWVEKESLLSAITALSGSGPAYGFLMIEAMSQKAQSLGLAPDVAQQFATQTLLGAAQMLAQSQSSPEQLRKNVTSKGGTTAAALNTFEQLNFSDVVAHAMQAAYDRSEQLAKELGDLAP